jgi:hypothetical protein
MHLQVINKTLDESMFAPFIMKVMAYCEFHQEQDVVAVAANAEQVTEQKNLNKWPHKIRRIL